jgi:hypothetical protein
MTNMCPSDILGDVFSDGVRAYAKGGANKLNFARREVHAFPALRDVGGRRQRCMESEFRQAAHIAALAFGWGPADYGRRTPSSRKSHCALPF